MKTNLWTASNPPYIDAFFEVMPGGDADGVVWKSQTTYDGDAPGFTDEGWYLSSSADMPFEPVGIAEVPPDVMAARDAARPRIIARIIAERLLKGSP